MSLKAVRFRQKRLAMTSLIDVIFLLLMYFMLATTFTRFSEVKLMTSGGATGSASTAPPRFVQLGPGTLALNGRTVLLDDLPAMLAADSGAVLIALNNGVKAQDLGQLLAALDRQGGLEVQVLEN
jgi:biopolymer transport protein ExbD